MIYWIWLSKLPGIGCHTSRILLKEFNDPKKIYQATYKELVKVKGIIKNQKKSIAIVGPRRCNKEVRQSAIDLARNQAEQGITIINGLDICYPSEHKNLMKEIEKNGALISEYEPGTPAYKANFPRRNRIIAALSDEIIIIEPKKGSGALITGQYGEKYHRKVIYQ